MLSASLLLLAAAGFERSEEPGRIATADRGAILMRDPVARGLRDLDRRRAALDAAGDSAARRLSAGRFRFDNLLARENDILFQGIAQRRSYQADALARALDGRLEASLTTTRAAYEHRARIEFENMIDALDRAQQSLDPGDFRADLSSIRRELLNLRIRLYALAPDNAYIPAARFEEMHARVNEIIGVIDAAERGAAQEYADAQNKLYDDIEDRYRRTMNAQERAFRDEMTQKMDVIRAEVESARRDYEIRVESDRQTAGERRLALAGALRAMNAETQPAPARGAQNAARDYEDRFFARLAPELDAAALDVDAAVLIAPPLYRSENVPDLTGRL